MNLHLSWDIFRNSLLLNVFIVTRYLPQQTKCNFRSHTHRPSLWLVVCSILQLIGPGFPRWPRRLSPLSGSPTPSPNGLHLTDSVAARVGSLRPSSDKGQSCWGIVSVLFFQTKDRRREHKYEALSPSTDSPATRRASHGTPTWATRGARAASHRVT